MATTVSFAPFLTLFAVLLCYHRVLAAPPTPSCNAPMPPEKVLCVVPVGAETTCPPQSQSQSPPQTPCSSYPCLCLTLDEYAKNSSYYPTKLKMCFLHGIHYLNHPLSVEGKCHMLIIQPQYPDDTINIVCNSTNASISIKNAKHVTLKSLLLTNCGYDSFSLSISDVTQLTIERIALIGRGDIKLHNIYGSSTISEGNFSNLRGPCKNSATLNIIYTDVHSPPSIVDEPSLTLKDIHFTNNTCSSILMQFQQLDYHVTTALTKVAVSYNAYDVNALADVLFLLMSNAVTIQVEQCSFKGSNQSIVTGLYFREVNRVQSSQHSYKTPQINLTNSDISGYQNGSCVLEFLNPGLDDTRPAIFIENVTISSSSTAAECLSTFAVLYSSIHRQLSTSLVMNKVTFTSNMAGYGVCNEIHSSVALLSFAANATITDCTFEGNTGTALTIVGTEVLFAGDVSFLSNKGVKGGALALYADGTVSLKSGARISFHNNRAISVGGAVYVSSCSMVEWTTFHDQNCFIKEGYSNASNNIYLDFTNNSATNGGNAIYGAMLSQCYVDVNSTVLGYRYVESVSNLNFSEPHSMSLASSHPTKVCVCNANNDVMCNNRSYHMAVYPGELFQVKVVLVGDMNGTVKGVIHAALRGNEAELGDSLQSVQQSNFTSCSQLSYSVLSSNLPSIAHLILSPTAIVPDTHSENEMDSATDIQVYVNLRECPVGFDLWSNTSQCGCDEKLQQMEVTCNVSSLQFHTQGGIWIGTVSRQENTYMYYSKYCPSNYCKKQPVSLQLNDAPGNGSLDMDAQCADNRLGILCGSCPNASSLALGSNRCLSDCTNHYLSLLVVFAVAGIALVSFIKVLNLTTAKGTINGLVFYANVIAVDPSLFFPPESIAQSKATLVISWINLDLGIETCFIKNLDGYTKAWLQFAFPTYVLVLALLIAIISRYSFTASRILGKNGVPVLTTLILLSYVKFLRTIAHALSFVRLQPIDSDGTILVWYYDGSLEYLRGKHIPLFVVSLTVLLIVILPLTLATLCSQWVQRITHIRGLHWVAKLFPFFDALSGPLKNQHRYWNGILLLTRSALITIYVSGGQSRASTELAFVGISTTLLMVGVAYIYRNVYVALLEYASLANLCILAIGTLYVQGTSGNQEALATASVAIATAQFAAVVIFHAWIELKEPAHYLCRKVTQRGDEVIPLTQGSHGSELECRQQEEPSHPPSKVVKIGAAHFQTISFSQYREPILEHLDHPHVKHTEKSKELI